MALYVIWIRDPNADDPPDPKRFRDALEMPHLMWDTGGWQLLRDFDGEETEGVQPLRLEHQDALELAASLADSYVMEVRT